MSTPACNRPIGIGIVTFNNLALIEKCFPSWRAPGSGHLVIFDNGSEPEVVYWLKRQRIERLILAPTNRGLCYARNRIIEYFRDRGEVEFVLLADSDVRFHEGMLGEMEAKIRSDPRLGFVGYPQANKGFPASPEGYVEEIASECQLTRLEMWREIGLYPERLEYYSGDSWKSTIANMHGWQTAVIIGLQGYDHFQHGSHVNPGVREAMERDVAQWARKEVEFLRYWGERLRVGKGNQYLGSTADVESPHPEALRTPAPARDHSRSAAHAPGPAHEPTVLARASVAPVVSDNPTVAVTSADVGYFERFHRASAHLGRLGVKHWIDFGTLLGAMRNGRMIPGDADVDMNFWHEDHLLIMSQRDYFEDQLGLVLFDCAEGIIKLHPIYPGLSRESEAAAYQSCMADGVPYLDLYPCLKAGKAVLHPVREYSFRTLYLAELGTIQFEGYCFPCPNNPASLLRLRYGPEWRHPMSRAMFHQQYHALITRLPEPLPCLVTGVFDETPATAVDLISHLTHYFDQIIVAVLSDQDAHRLKGRPCRPCADRIAPLIDLRLVDGIISSPPLPLTVRFCMESGIPFCTTVEPDLWGAPALFGDLPEQDMIFRDPETL